MDRKIFNQKTASAMRIAIPAYSLLGCSSSDDVGENQIPDSDASADCLDNGTAVAIGSNHGYTLSSETGGSENDSFKELQTMIIW